MGRTRTRTVDAAGRTLESVVAGLLPVTSTYDGQGHLLTTAQGGRTSAYGYSPEGFLETVTDPLLQTTAFGRDGVGRVLTTTKPDGQIVQQSYDLNGNVLSVTPPAKPAHGMSYSPVDLLTTYDPPDAGFTPRETTWDYNVDKQVELLSQPDGKTLDHGYDFAGRLSTLTTPAETRSRTYDAATGKLATVATPEVTLSYQYDGDLVTDTTWSGAVSGTVSLAYDDDFRVVTETVNAEAPVAIGYDLDSLLVGAGDLAVTRDPQNGLVTATSLGQVAEAFSYSGYGEPATYAASFGGATLYSASYVRDDIGRIVDKTETVEGVTTLYGYGYDLAGRLVEVTVDGVVESIYEYDENGNRLTKTTADGTTLGSYDAQDRMLSYGPLDFTYTENGELSSRTDLDTGEITGFEYDVYGNLTRVTLPSGSVIEYVVDGEDRRVLKKVDGVVVKGWLYRDDLRPIAELDAAGNVVARFVYALGRNVPDYMVTGGSTYKLVTDQVGSVRLVVDVATGAVAQRIDYDAWGVVLSDSNPGFQPFGFAGGLDGADTGLVRFGARDYDAETGRWTSKDPILFDGRQANLYLYVGGDPANAKDESGLSQSQDENCEYPKRYAKCLNDCQDARDDDCAAAGKSMDQCTEEWRECIAFCKRNWCEGGVSSEDTCGD